MVPRLFRVIGPEADVAGGSTDDSIALGFGAGVDGSGFTSRFFLPLLAGNVGAAPIALTD